MTPLVLSFYAPKTPLSINKANTLHWGARRRLTDPWKDMGIVTARMASTREALKSWGGQVPVSILVALPFRTAARRDPHNYTSTTIKALVDGLVVGGLIPDDTPEWATIMDPVLDIQRDKTKPLTARVTITPRSTT